MSISSLLESSKRHITEAPHSSPTSATVRGDGIPSGVTWTVVQPSIFPRPSTWTGCVVPPQKGQRVRAGMMCLAQERHLEASSDEGEEGAVMADAPW